LIHVMPTRLPPETVQQWCQDEREQIVRYAAALAQEQAARRGIEVWRGTANSPLPRHTKRPVELSGIMSPFTALSETMSRACGT
jgi:hypothetical protein